MVATQLMGANWVAIQSALVDLMDMGGPTKVVMIVLNDVENDSRVIKIAHSLQSNGYDVTIFGLSKERAEISSVTREIHGINVRLFFDPRRTLSFGCESGDKWKLLLRGLIGAMWAYLKTISPQVIHTHDFGTIRIGSELARKLRSETGGLLWVHDVHEYVAGLEQLDEGILREALLDQEECIGLPQTITTVSGPIARAIKEDHLLPRVPTTIFNCPNNPGKFFEYGIKDHLKLSAEHPLIVYSGGLAEQRGVETVISALKTLRSHHFCIVTDTNSKYLPRIIDHAKKLEVDGRVHVHGYVNHDEVPSFLSDADIAVHPMIRYKNGDMALPNKLFEYLHAKLPIIVSDCRTMADFVGYWELGKVFESGDIASLISAISEIQNNPPKDEDFEQRDSLIERYSWERQEEKLLAIYSNGINEAFHPVGVDSQIEIEITSIGNAIKGILNMDNYSGPYCLSFTEGGESLCEAVTDKSGYFSAPMPHHVLDGVDHNINIAMNKWGRKIVKSIGFRSEESPLHYGEIVRIEGNRVVVGINQDSKQEFEVTLQTSEKSVPTILNPEFEESSGGGSKISILIPEQYSDGKARILKICFKNSKILFSGCPVEYSCAC